MSRPLRWLLSALIGSTVGIQVQAQDPQPADPTPAEAPMPAEEAADADLILDTVLLPAPGADDAPGDDSGSESEPDDGP